MKTKMYITILIVMIILSAITVNNFKSIAISDANIIVDTKNVVQGNEVEVNINLQNSVDFSAVNFILTYDSTILEYKGYKVGSVLKKTDGSTKGEVAINANTSGEIKMGYISEANQETETKVAGKLFTIIFKVNSGAGAITEIELKAPTLKQDDGSDVSANITNGKLKIISGIQMNHSSLTLKIGNTSNLSVETLPMPVDISNENITWTSSNPSIATVSEGVVTAITTGTATIKATVLGKTAECTVVVSEPVPEITINLNRETLILPREQIRPLKAKVEGTTEENTNVLWFSSNEEIATVDLNGYITAVSDGTTTITAKIGEKTATCMVIVSGKLGDVDKDETITAYDAYKALEASANISIGIDVQEQIILTSDVDKDENVEAQDAYTILQYSVGLIDKF